MADKMMDRISKVLRQAERAEPGSPEHIAFMEKANTLAQAHSIDLALARSHAIKKEEVQKPERRSHPIGDYRDRNGRVQETTLAHFVDLFLAIAHVYDLKCTIAGGNTAVHAVGFPADHEVAERIYSILSVQMVTEADKALANNENKEEKRVYKRTRVRIASEDREWGGNDGHGSYYDDEPGVPSVWAERRYQKWSWGEDVPSHEPPEYRYEFVLDDDGNRIIETQLRTVTDARVWRKDYYKGFVSRIGSRLRAEKRQAYRDAGVEMDDASNERGLAIVAKEEQVAKAHEEEIERLVLQNGKPLGSYQDAGPTRDWTAHEKGQEAGERAATGNERVVS